MTFAVVLDNIPSEITAGESVSWKWSDSDFPASDSWVLTYTLVNASGQIQITASADDDDHLVEIGSSTSGSYAAGEYEWQAHISNGTERYQVAVGTITIKPDFAEQSSGYDSRSHAKKVIDAIEAAIEGRASKTQMTQMVGSVQVQHMPLADQVKMLGVYRAKYRKELVAEGKAKPNRTIKARFV